MCTAILTINHDNEICWKLVEEALCNDNCFHFIWQKEKIVFSITSLDIFDDKVIVLMDELLQQGTMVHIFNEEEKSSVINTVRTSGDQEKARLSKSEAWEVFIKWDVFLSFLFLCLCWAKFRHHVESFRRILT